MTRSGYPVVLVTGGVRGIGAAITRRFLAAAWRVVVTSRDVASFQAFVEELPDDQRGRVSHLEVDFRREGSLDRALEEIRSWNVLNTLVNNAGTNTNNPLPALRTEDLDHLDRVNLRAPILIMQAAASVMKRSGGGRIVNIASIWSVITREGRLAYAASKFGLVGATITAAVDLASDGILVNAVSPGFTWTELTASTLSPEEMTVLADRVPLGRFAETAEVAGIVHFLGGPENTYITGQNIVIDGGYTIV